MYKRCGASVCACSVSCSGELVEKEHTGMVRLFQENQRVRFCEESASEQAEQ